MNAAPLILGLSDLIITEYLAFAERRKQAADYKPDEDTKALWLAKVAADTTETIQAEVAKEAGATSWAEGRKEPKPEAPPPPPPASVATDDAAQPT